MAIVYRKYSGAVAVRDVLSSLRPVVIALITAAGLSMLLTVLFGNQSVSIQNVQWISVVLFVAAFFILRTLKWNPILVMCLCGVTNLLIYCIFHI